MLIIDVSASLHRLQSTIHVSGGDYDAGTEHTRFQVTDTTSPHDEGL